MLTKNDIIHFYDRYKKNLKKEEQVIARLLQVKDQEEWIDNLKKKSRVMRSLYIENEALLNMYVRPFLENGDILSDELAEEFLHQIIQADQEGYMDDLAMREVVEQLEPYFEKKDHLNDYIWTINMIGSFYNRSSGVENGKRSAQCYRKLQKLSSRYFEIEDFEVRKRILYSYYNYPVVLFNFGMIGPKGILEEMERAIAFYTDERVVALDGGRFDFKQIMEELSYDLLGNYMIASERDTVDPELLERAGKELGRYYQSYLDEGCQPYEVPDEIYCNYHRYLFFSGKMSFTEFVEDYKRFCDYSVEHDTMDEEDADFTDSRLFQVAVNHLTNIIYSLKYYEKEYEGDPNLVKECINQYIQVLRRVPRAGNAAFVNDVMYRSLCGLLEMFADDEEGSKILTNILMNRDEITLIHASMVDKISHRILDVVLKKKPELLVGALGCTSVMEVLEQPEKFFNFMEESAKLFDIGKLQIAEIINKQSRRLTGREKKRIYEHPKAGTKVLEKIPSMQKYRDMILGHHKSWDGKMGYPKDFDNCASPDRMLIEILRISDCLDAATDFIGRSYGTAKNFAQCLEEFSLGKGTLYCQELIELLEGDAALQDELTYLLEAGRIRTYYEIFWGMMGPCDEEQEKHLKERWKQTELDDQEELLGILHESGRENRSVIRALARNSLLILSVNMRNGDYTVTYRGKSSLFAHLENGRYENFLQNCLAPAADASDWEKVRYKLRLKALAKSFAEQSGSYETELRIRTEHMMRWVRFQFVQTDEINVIPNQMIVILQDVHDTRSRSEQLKQSMKEAYDAAEHANRAKSLFLTSMSHDIRTPMNGIMGMTQIARKHLDDTARVEDCLRKIEESSKQLLGLINEVLDMAKIESGSAQLKEEALSLPELVEAVGEVCRTDAERKHQQFDVIVGGIRHGQVLADPVKLRQILTNLTANAVKYTPDGGRVELLAEQVSLSKDGYGSYRFIIRDNGIGMSEEFQKQLFQPFSREDNSMTNVTQGTGLGLSIVKSVIDMMGGSIEVQSVQGQGSTFTVLLQFALAQERAEESETEEEIYFDGRRILLVEDNELNREIACELFSEIGLVVETAQNGQEAIESIVRRPDYYYELVFMDIQMPVLNGYEATRKIRNVGKRYTDQLPVIAMTANVFQDDILEAIESGMNDHVAKPIDMKVISGVLRRWLLEKGTGGHREAEA